MDKSDHSEFKYLVANESDHRWGITATSVGFQRVDPDEAYPSPIHPRGYYFDVVSGRVLDEYQLIYVVDGEGTLRTESGSYRLTASGAILDALNLGRPVITLRNDCFDDVLRLPVGYVVADMEEMAALIRRLAAEYPAGTDPQFARNIALLRREFAVETVAERLREALESFVPELKNPQR